MMNAFWELPLVHHQHCQFHLSQVPQVYATLRIVGFDRYGHTDTDTPLQNLYQTDIDICFEIHIKPIPIYLY